MKTMMAFAHNYDSSYRNFAFDPTHLATTTIADPRVCTAVLVAWHEINKAGVSESRAFEADVDFRFATIGLGTETVTPMNAQTATDLSHLQSQPSNVRRLWKRLSSETINLADHEVLEAVLAPVVASQNASRIVQLLLLEFGTFGQVIHAAASDLMGVEGLGEAGVTALKTVGAAALHMLRRAINSAPRIRMWDDLMRYVIARLQHERVEVFFGIFLDSAMRVIADEEINRGTIDRVSAYPREIIRRCLELDATGLILVHNHPTGILEASREDVAFTQDIVRAAKPIGIAVHDHIIVGRGECFSFRVNKLLDD